MQVLKIYILLLLTFQTLWSYTLYDNIVEDKVWKRGETLLAFMEENLLPLKLYYDLDDEDEKITSDIRGNTVYQILRDENYNIKQVLIPLNEELQIHIYREADGHYTLSIDSVRYQTSKGVLLLDMNSSFSQDVMAKTGNFPLAVELEQIFHKTVSFEKLRKGTKVVAFYTKKIRMGKFYGTQKVHCALIKTHKKSYYEFLAKDGQYYDDQGKTHDSSSFMVPCKYRRISSKFTLKRWHPILHRYRPHHGIDYAAPIGTPIHAAYDGKIIFMGRKGGYGNAIVIQHPGGYKTLYGHLSRFRNELRRKNVKKGTIIGYLGNTGMSTGPHLHFGLSFHNQWINPDLKIVFTKRLQGKKRQVFLKRVAVCRDKMDHLLKKGTFDGKKRKD